MPEQATPEPKPNATEPTTELASPVEPAAGGSSLRSKLASLFSDVPAASQAPTVAPEVPAPEPDPQPEPAPAPEARDAVAPAATASEEAKTTDEDDDLYGVKNFSV